MSTLPRLHLLHRTTWLVLILAAGAVSAEAPQRGGRGQGAGGPAGPAGPVTMDFRVLGEDGQPVLDLKAEEVTLRINGRERPIRALDLVRIEAPASPGVPLPFATNLHTRPSREVLILVEDESLPPGRDQSVKDAIGELLNRLAPGDRVGLMTLPRMLINVPATERLDEVRRAVSTMTARASAGTTAACRSRDTLTTIKNLLPALPGDVPLTLVFFSYGLTAPGAGTAECTITTTDYNSLEALAFASRTNAYIVHVVESVPTNAGLENLTGAVGGEIIRLTDRGEQAMAGIVRDSSSYYVATFDPDPADRSSATARVEVRTSRERVRVRVRPQMTLARAGGGGGRTARDLAGDLRVYRELPIRAAAFASRNAGDDRIRVVALAENATPGEAFKELMLVLFDASGKAVAQWTAQAGDLGRSPVIGGMVAPPGTYRMRVAAIDAAGRRGTTDYALSAGLTAADPFTTSAMLMGVAQDRAFAPRLVFTGSDGAAICYMELYGTASGPVTARFELARTADGEAMAVAQGNVAGPNQAGMSVVTGGFNISGLEPGTYAVRGIVMVDGKAVGRVDAALHKQ